MSSLPAIALNKVFAFFSSEKQTFLACLLLSFPAASTPRAVAAAHLADIERAGAEQAQAQTRAARDLAAAQSQAARLDSAHAREAALLRARDAGVTDASRDFGEAARRAARSEADLAATQRAFDALLPVMLRLSQHPTEALLARPASADDAPLVICGLAITLNREATLLGTTRDEALAARAAAARQEASRAAARTQQAARAAELSHILAAAQLQVSVAETDGRQAALHVAQAAAQARTLRGAIAAMDRAAAAEAVRAEREAELADSRHQADAARSARARQAAVTRPAGAPMGLAAIRLVAPVAGPVVRAFGTAGVGGAATGTAYGAAAGAPVLSPCAGRVAFAAPFRSYGRLLILECGGGYDVVLAGFGSLTARPGDAVQPSEWVGRMPLANGRPLYVELRANGKPVDPALFLKAGV